MSHPNPFVYAYTRSGFDQVHFRRTRVKPAKGGRHSDHFAAQGCGKGRFRWVLTSSDGEPDHEIEVDWNDVPIPPQSADTSCDDLFRKFLQTVQSPNHKACLDL
jgi:hypothetical protein